MITVVAQRDREAPDHSSRLRKLSTTLNGGWIFRNLGENESFNITKIYDNVKVTASAVMQDTGIFYRGEPRSAYPFF